jgi:hypothetical protein
MHDIQYRLEAQRQRARLGGDAFSGQNPGEVILHRARAHRPQVELQAA